MTSNNDETRNTPKQAEVLTDALIAELREALKGGEPFLTALVPKAAIEKVIALLSSQANDAKAQEDAKRWRALLGSARIRPLGSAGLTSEANPNGEPYNGYAHLGLELWTIFGASLNDEGRERLAKENLLGVEWLTKYTDIAAIQGMQTGSGE